MNVQLSHTPKLSPGALQKIWTPKPTKAEAGNLLQDQVKLSSTSSTSSSALSSATQAKAVQSEPPQAPKADTSWHKEQVIYFPITDRFHDGDPNNNYLVDRAHPAGFWGGDLKGLTEKLDYIQSLGATSVWLSPLADNTDEFRIGDYHGYGHHGYWIRDHYEVEPHQGNLDDAKRLVQEAHKRGMKVILDVVLNHVGPDHPFVNDPEKQGWFHNEGAINDWDNQHELEKGDLGGLPDLKQSNPETYQYLMDNTLWWIKETGVDGIRLDAVKHIEKDFWAKFVPEIKEKSGKDDLFVMGEVFHGDPNYVADYQRMGIDYVFDLPLYYTMNETFAQGHSMKRIGERLAQDALYPEPDKLVTVLDNHDLPRFLHEARDTFPGEGDKRLKQAMAFLTTVRGVPSLYYGTEAGFKGGHDPHNREMMDFEARPDLNQALSKLTGIRSNSEALQHGVQREMWTDDSVYAFSRATENEEVIAVFHNGTDGSNRRMPLRAESNFENGTILVDALSGREFEVREGQLDLHLEPLTPLILKAKE